MSTKPGPPSDQPSSDNPKAQEYKQLMESFAQAIWETDAIGQVVEDSPSWRAYTGQTLDQWLQQGWIGAIHPQERGSALAQWQAALDGQVSLNAEFRFLTADGSWRWTNVRATAIHDEVGNLIKWVGANIDITGRKQAEQGLLQSETQFRLLTALSSDTLYKMNADWSLMVNLKGFDFLADTLRSNRNWFEEYIPTDEQARVRAAIDHAVSSKSLFELEHRVFLADGSIGWTFSRAIPLLDEHQEIIEWFGTARDTTKRKLAEERQDFLLKLSDQLRPLQDPLAIQEMAAHLLGVKLGADRVLYAEVIGDGHEYLIARNYLASDDTIPVIGSFQTLQFGQWLVHAGKGGHTMVANDVINDQRLTPSERDAFLGIDLRAFITTPLNKDGRWVAAIKIHQAHARKWTDLEVSLVEEVAERTWAAVERAKAEQALHENEARLKSQKDAFQAAVDGASLEVSLGLLISNSIHQIGSGGERAAFYILDKEGAGFYPLLKVGNMDEGYLRQIQNLATGDGPLPCEFAVSAQGTVITSDIFEDPDWDRYLPLAKEFDFRACWSFAIATQSGKTVGAFVMYFRHPHVASLRDFSLAQSVTHAAAIIISRYNEVEQRKQAVQAMADSERRLRLAVDATELATWEWDLESGEVFWNEQHFKLLGMEPGDRAQPSDAFFDKVHADDFPRIRAELRRAIDEHGLYDADFRIIRQDDGALCWMSSYGRVTEILHGKPISMSGVMFDITERKKAEESLRYSEQRQRAILESAKDYAILTLDLDRRVSSWNAGAQAMLGYTEPDIIGQSGDIFFVPEDRAKAAPEQEVGKALETGRCENERWHVRKDGTRFYGSGVTTPFLDESGRVMGVLKVMRDLTASKEAEQALERSQQRLEKALSIPTVGVLFFDEAGTFTGANDAFLAISGYCRPQVESGELNTSQMTLPEWMPRTREALDELKTLGRSSPFEKQLQRADGSRWWGLFAGTRLSQTEYVEFILDITYRKTAEEALLEAGRRKDEFLALLAHELRNPMATLSNTLMILEMTGGKQDTLPLEKALLMMRREVVQLVRLVDDLLDVSRINQGKIELRLERVDLTELVEEACQAARPLIEAAGRQLSVMLPGERLYLLGDAARLTQVVRNLLTNAAKFTHEDGHIWLDLARHADQSMLRVRDDGIGIPSDQLESIFGMFAQVDASHTRTQGGLGLGLTLVREFVDKHGGHVEARSPGLGQGSEFVICLPLLTMTK